MVDSLVDPTFQRKQRQKQGKRVENKNRYLTHHGFSFPDPYSSQSCFVAYEMSLHPNEYLVSSFMKKVFILGK
ncbi:CLUMA_CG016133, isoform A [Clunio marinus]|uniref:CLUMA_CG016133, isoform A n=1 Tax=Clunio marinus TaxID=568069 RepID=A0A1J1IWA5_9DIPT|nr:CLUMA_CG016133, isoform A [Clunio marinus]